jgi:hypothetical protein
MYRYHLFDSLLNAYLCESMQSESDLFRKIEVTQMTIGVKCSNLITIK